MTQSTTHFAVVLGLFIQAITLPIGFATEYSDLPNEIISEISTFLPYKDALDTLITERRTVALAPKFIKDSRKVIDLSKQDLSSDQLNFLLNEKTNLIFPTFDISLRNSHVPGLSLSFPSGPDHANSNVSLLKGLFSKASGFIISLHQLNDVFMNKLSKKIRYLKVIPNEDQPNLLNHQHFVYLQRFTNLEVLDFSNVGISLQDEPLDLRPLSELKKLTELRLHGIEVSDISPLASLENLTILDLFGTRVSNLQPLSRLKRLAYLDLGHTQVSDLTPLFSMNALELVSVAKAPISDYRPIHSLAKRMTVIF